MYSIGWWRTDARGIARAMSVVIALGASPLPSLAQRASAPLRVSLDMLAAGRKVSGDVLGEHVWGGGGMVAAELRVLDIAGIRVGALGASTPQMNFKDHAMLNELSPSASVVWYPMPHASWQPYAITGLSWQRFKVEEPPPGIAANATYAATQLGAGVMHDLTRFVAWKTELTSQMGKRGTSYGMATGLSVRVSGARPQPRPMVDTVVRRDTVLRFDTTIVTRERRITDTLVVHDTVLVDRPREVTRVVRGEDIILVLRDANFDFAKSNLRPEAFPTLDTLSTQLKNPERPLRILVTGHTDDIGSDEANQALGQARANAVRDYLVQHGITADRIETASDGERRPIASNKSAAGRQLNRRVVISRLP